MKYKLSKKDFAKLMMKKQKDKGRKKDDLYFAYLYEQKGKKKYNLKKSK